MVSAVCPSAIWNSPCCSPIRWICDKITAVARSIFSYLVRIVVFQLAEMNAPGAFFIMRIYQRLSSDPREERPFDPNRLAESKNLLIRFGGVETIVQAADGGSQVHCMTFKSTDFFAQFRALGSEPIDIVHEGRKRRALLNPPPETSKFYFDLIDIQLEDGRLVKGALLPESPVLQGPPPMIVHFHSPGRSMCMDRKLVGKYLAAGYNLTISDQRGTGESTGRATEGGYYLDAEAVFQHVRDQGYEPNRIYVSGFCEGAAIAAHLKKKFHRQGVHFIAGNPYTSMKEVIESHGCLGRLGSRFGIAALQDPNLNVSQDYFDNVKKFHNLPRSQGKFILVHTDNDTLMPRGTVSRLAAAIDRAGPIHEILRVHPKPKENGHVQPPWEDDLVWRRLIQVVT